MDHIGKAFGCRHGGAILARGQDASGWRIGLYCDPCHRWIKPPDSTGYWYAADHPAVAKAGGRDALPLRGEVVIRLCEACGCLARCQDHHIAPRRIFGEDADRWPRVWLCIERIVANEWAGHPSCHQRWHDVLTPGLMGRHDAAEHARLLALWLSARELSQLNRALTAMLMAGVP